jgi:hypothetical protein
MSETNPIRSIAACLAFSSRDWSLNHRDAWIWGVAVGWPEEALQEVARNHNWSPETVARLRALRKRAEEMEKCSHTESG